MRFQRKTGIVNTFAVVIDKTEVKYPNRVDPRERAWTYAIERLVSFGRDHDDYVHVLPDEGHSDYIRKEIHRMRRNHIVPGHYGGTLNEEAKNVVGDCSPRDSGSSYFIQFADLNAYAAFRKVYPGKNFGEYIWDELGSARIKEVSTLSGGPMGIKLWPT